MKYLCELVQKEYPYINMGYVRKDSIEKDELEFARNSGDALVIEDMETMERVLDLIAVFISDRDHVYVMPWITEFGKPNKRLFRQDLTF